MVLTKGLKKLSHLNKAEVIFLHKGVPSNFPGTAARKLNEEAGIRKSKIKQFGESLQSLTWKVLTSSLSLTWKFNLKSL